MLRHSRRFAAVVAVHVVAVVIGIGGALATHAETSAFAATHCTRYAPSILAVDTNCTTLGTMTNGRYETTSFAWRDSNRVRLDAARWWELWYYDTTGATYGYQGALSTGNTIGGVSAVQTKPVCTMSNGTSVLGECDTGWHD